MFSKFYYKRKLKFYKAKRCVERYFLNIKDLKHLVVAIEIEDATQMRELEKEIKPVLNIVPMVTNVFYMNTKDVSDLSVAADSNDILLCREDLARKLTPKPDVVERLDALKPDVFVNLMRESSNVIDFFSEISKAKMRVGFEEKKEVVDLMISVQEDDGYKPFFEKLLQLMNHVNG